VKKVLTILFFPLLLFPQAALAQPLGIEGCAGCHGARGEGNPDVGGPRIAGQPQAYLARQLTAYAEGTRMNEVMAPIAKQLKPEKRSELAAHYSQLQPPPRKPAGASAGASGNPRGRALAVRGDEAARVQACENCHGPGGTGQHNLNPSLAGLDRKYLETSLREWKDGSRKTDPSQQMNLIGKSLSASDIQAVAQHYASQPAPQPMVTEKPAAKAPPEGTRAGSATQQREGRGVTGGEPSGSQGPGGAGAR
jgi:cytochrome c553